MYTGLPLNAGDDARFLQLQARDSWARIIVAPRTRVFHDAEQLDLEPLDLVPFMTV